jgi:pimeloyl-ACP methyl ester carboxylesterase
VDHRGGEAMSFLTTQDGVRLRVADRGAGPAIVFVHGWKLSHRVFDRQVARLAERFRVVAFDLRGMGESDKPGSRYDFEELAGDLGFVIGELGLDDVTLVGWSMGCSVSLAYLQSSGAGVGRLVLVNGPIRLTRTHDFPWTMTEGELDAYLADLADHWPTRERRFTADSLLDPDPVLVDALFQITQQTPLDIALRVVREQAKLDFRPLLPKIEIPVLAVYGAHDPYYPTELAHLIARSVPRGEAVVFDRSAHYPFIEEADRFAAILAEFVTR